MARDGRTEEYGAGSPWVDGRGVDKMIECIVPGCDTYVTRRRGMCSEHWFKLPAKLRAEIQDASRADDRDRWMAATRAAVKLLGERPAS